MENTNHTIHDDIGGEDSPNTVSESALEQSRPIWMNPAEQRETQSNQSFAEWQKANPSYTQVGAALPRPQGGSSRKNLLLQIEQLEIDKAELQLRLRALMSSETTGQPSSSRLQTDDQRPLVSPIQPSIVGTNESGSSSLHTTVDFPSTFASSNPESDESQHEYLDQVVTLAGKLRMALAPDESDDSSKDPAVPFTLLGRPELKEMLLRATPHPERANHYAHIFAKRSLELYKQPKNRSSMLQAGPLQKAFKHPRYVDILAKCLREPFIAHMGKFDEMEFCLWLVTETDFHATDPDEEGDETDELDDSCYEFSLSFLIRFPFAGTKQLISNTNVWRNNRSEVLIIQTKEMKEAEEYTNSMQIEAAALPSQY